MKLKKILDKIKFINLKSINSKDKKIIRNLRNEKDIRKNMFTSHLISEKEHSIWLKKIKSQSKEIFYGIYFEDQIVGGLGLKDILKKKQAYWSFYISNKNKVSGLGALVEYKALNFFFKFYKFLKINCFVLKKNQLVIKLHKKFGFVECKTTDKKMKINYYKKVIKLELKNSDWKKISKKFENLFNK